MELSFEQIVMSRMESNTALLCIMAMVMVMVTVMVMVIVILIEDGVKHSTPVDNVHFGFNPQYSFT